MTTPERKPPSIRWLFLLIAGSSALLLILIGIGLDLWFGSPKPLMIMTALAAMLLLVLSATYFVMNRRAQDGSVITVSGRYAIKWWERAGNEDRWEQLRSIIFTALFVAACVAVLVALGRLVLQPLLRAPARSPTDVALIVGGVLVAILLIVGIATVFRRLVAMPSGTGWRWTAIVVALLLILLGAWLFYGGRFPTDWAFLHARRAKAGPAPLIALGVVVFFGTIAWLAARGRRLEMARDMTVFGAVVFWLTALFDLEGPAAIPVAVAVPALVVITLLVYALLRMFEQIVKALRAFFRALLQMLAALISFPPKLGRKVWDCIINNRFWKRVDAWIDLKGEQLRILGQYSQQWTETLLRWANGTISLEEARPEWATTASERDAAWEKAHVDYTDRLNSITGQKGSQ